MTPAGADLIERAGKATGQVENLFARRQERLIRMLHAVWHRFEEMGLRLKNETGPESSHDAEKLVELWKPLTSEFFTLLGLTPDDLERLSGGNMPDLDPDRINWSGLEDWTKRTYRLIIFERSPRRHTIHIPATEEEWQSLPPIREELEKRRRAIG